MNEEKKQAVSSFLSKGILVSPDILNSITEDNSKLEDEVSKQEKDFLLLSKDTHELLTSKKKINWQELEKLKVVAEKTNGEAYGKVLKQLATIEPEQEIKGVKVVFSYNVVPHKIEVADFVSLFNERYKAIERMLAGRPELTNMLSINRIKNKRERENISFIGIVADKQQTKNQNIMLTMEDQTGTIKVMVNKTKPELYAMAKDIVLDEVIGISGINAEKIVFANSIVWPDIPNDKELKKGPEEEYAVFLSDLHVGSKFFLEEEFLNFLAWINGRKGTPEQLRIAESVKYIFIVGDMVDGVGIYPGQEKELIIPDIYKQYEKCAELLKEIPSSIPVIICAGNHDAMRISEPQLELYKDFAASLWQLPNAIMVSNPSLINIGSKKDFKGFDVLLYHGYSFDYYASEVDSIRSKGGYDKPDLIMKFLLKRRHLAPSHSSTLYMPDANQDCLVISKVPDLFVTGHIHRSSVSNYRNVTMICGSCWQSKTPFQEKCGHKPEPCRVPIVNLQTRNVKLLKFSD
ncbi:MAG: DNA-directed DNA polymerase II small subunit [Candidatus Woesearchaeota archaeon]